MSHRFLLAISIWAVIKDALRASRKRFSGAQHSQDTRKIYMNLKNEPVMRDWIGNSFKFNTKRQDHIIVTLVDINISAPQVVGAKMIVTGHG